MCIPCLKPTGTALVLHALALYKISGLTASKDHTTVGVLFSDGACV